MIRHAQRTDLEAIATLLAAVQNQHAHEHPQLFKRVVPADMHSVVAAAFDRTDVFHIVCEEPFGIVGYALVEPRQRPENSFTFPDSYLHVDQVCVSSEHRRRGHAKALLDWCKNYALSKGMQRVQLETWHTNALGQAAFAKCGFKPFMTRSWSPV